MMRVFFSLKYNKNSNPNFVFVRMYMSHDMTKRVFGPRVSRTLKKGQGGIQKKGTWCALCHSKTAHFVRTLAVRKDKSGISNIMWKSTSIFTGTGRLTVED